MSFILLAIVVVGHRLSSPRQNVGNQRETAVAMLRISIAPFHWRQPPPLEPLFEAHPRLINGRLVIDRALAYPNVAALASIRSRTKESAARWLIEQIEADRPKGSELLRVWIRGPKTPEKILLVNAVADAYLETVAEAQEAQADARHSKYRVSLILPAR